MGGYGIVGGHMPIAAGSASRSKYRHRGRDALPVRRRRVDQGAFGEALASRRCGSCRSCSSAEQPVRDGHGARPTRGHRPAQRKGEGFGVPGMRCDGMDVARHVQRHARGAAACARRAPADPGRGVTYRFRGHSMADPDEYRTKEQVEEWRRRDPLATFGDAAGRGGRDRRGRREQLEAEAVERDRRGGDVRRRVAVPARPSRSTTMSTCSAARCAAGARLTSVRRRRTAARTSAQPPVDARVPRGR